MVPARDLAYKNPKTQHTRYFFPSAITYQIKKIPPSRPIQKELKTLQINRFQRSIWKFLRVQNATHLTIAQNQTFCLLAFD